MMKERLGAADIPSMTRRGGCAHTSRRAFFAPRRSSRRNEGCWPLTVDYPIGGASRTVLGSLDREGRITEISGDASESFGRDPVALVGRPLTELFRPDDSATVKALLTRALLSGQTSTTEVDAAVWSSGKQRLRVAVGAVRSHAGARIAFAVTEVVEPQSARDECRAAEGRYELHLRRIATEIRAAGMDEAPLREAVIEDGLMRLMKLQQLSERQIEIVRRLLRGQRVSTIAKSLYLSESTVRNHLCSVYRKLGVHSQTELLEMLSDSVEENP